MLKTLKALFRDEHGFIVSIELVLIATIGVLSLIVGLSCLSNAIVAEYQDLGWAVRGLNQSYYFGGFRGCKSWVPGSAFNNRSAMPGYVTDANWDQGFIGASYGTGYAAPTYVAPQGSVLQQPAIPCPTGDCPTGSAVPCPAGDCATEKVVPGTTLQPVPDSTLPLLFIPAPSIPAPVTPQRYIPLPVLPPVQQ